MLHPPALAPAEHVATGGVLAYDAGLHGYWL